MSNRINRVNSLIQKKLGSILLKEIEFPKDVLVTITRVDTAPNLSIAKIFISVINDIHSDKVLRILNRKVYFIQQSLNHILNMRPIPKIEFRKEIKTIQAARVEEVLSQLKNDTAT